MKVAKSGIRVIKREERARQEQRKIETQDKAVEPDLDKAQARELASSVAEWVNDFLRRRHDGFPEELGGQLRALFDR
ncbi:MAG TPA: hypothetical protein VF656_08165 [Pyrinomonadaceae bacterium]|jgi:hypothetical protein